MRCVVLFCRWDYINVDEILRSERLINNYVKCLLEKGPCTPDGAELKSECRQTALD
jgi:hypothetical protein